MTASSLRPSSQPISSPGGTTSASWRLPRLRHLPVSPRASLTTMSVRPASLRPATRFDPMNPAPPVTNSIPHPPQLSPPPFAPGRPLAQLAPPAAVNLLLDSAELQGYGSANSCPLSRVPRGWDKGQTLNLDSYLATPPITDERRFAHSDRALHV